jgi:hypothetical protein
MAFMSMVFNIMKNKLKEFPLVELKSVSMEQLEKGNHLLKEIGEKLRAIFLKEIGFNQEVQLKNKTELPIIGKSKVLYVLPNKTSLSWHRKSKEYKKFDIDKAIKKIFDKID